MSAGRAGNPNIVYILADDMGWGDLSCLNPESRIPTARLDGMAREGLLFTDAHASSAVCTPSRYSLLTGRYNWRSRLKSHVLGGYSPPLVEQGRLTVAELLRRRGYRTACVGKWHLGLHWGGCDGAEPENFGVMDVDYGAPVTGGPVDRGFDRFYGISASLDMPPYVYIENDRVAALPDHETEGADPMAFWRKGPTAPGFVHGDVLPNLTRRALSILEEWAGEPFFLYFPLPAPHTPILPGPEFMGRTGTNAYGDFVLMCDAVVGRVLDKLEDLGIAGDTLVIFTSDNGCSPMADFPALARAGHRPSAHFRGHKADIYEGGHRIPLILRWPQGVPPGRVSDEPVCLTDLMATVAELLGVALPDDAGEDSVSNLSLWQGRPYDPPLRRSLVHQSIDGSLSLRRGPWKLEMCPGSGGWSDPKPGEEPPGAPELQLYRLDGDPGERRNLWDQYPAVAADMKAELARIVRRGRSTAGAPQPNATGDWPRAQWIDGMPED